MEKEVWKEIDSFKFYRVSNLGRVKSLKRYRHPKETIMKQYGNYVRLDTKEKSNQLRIDLLVAKAFLPKAKVMEVVIHKDGNEQNNNADNLAWSTETLKEKISIFRANLRKKQENQWLKKGDCIFFKMSNTSNYGICDEEDWEKLRIYTWYENSKGYAETRIKGRLRRMHQLVLSQIDGYIVDHINRNKLDNRRVNLRYATQSVNMINQSMNSRNTTGIRGVTKAEKGRYRAQINIRGKHICLGRYTTIEEAQKARLAGEAKYFDPIIEQESFQ